MNRKINLCELLEYINPADLSYQEWCSVGMALKEEGYTVADWDQWSRKDFDRYHNGECEKKWNTFRGTTDPVTGGTIYQMAVDRGYVPEYGHELDWEDDIEGDGSKIVDKSWLEGKEIHEPAVWHPAAELIRYLETLFEPGENVGYVTKSWQNDKGKYIPQDKGNWDRTAGQLIEALNKCGDDIGSVIGDYNVNGGAWIRFNPLDGKGVRNENVTDLRYALVESDDMDLDKQNSILRELELPIACLVYSGGKSLHAIVRIEAADYKEYRSRVDYLYNVCKKNGMHIDTQNKNPSRLSRIPGCLRGEKKQFIVDTNIGKASWTEWKEWIESINDDLPEVEELSTVWDNLPELAPCLIDSILRQGHKLLVTGPSKAGKSFLLIELCIAIAEGQKWLQWQCTKGRILYVNLELDRASCLHRFADVYKVLGIQPNNLGNIDIWNLRGRSTPMDKLAPKLIRRARKKNYIAIIIDPIYKVITGDENSADQMANFCNQFDLVCTELGAAVIYCHHHSKGAQGGKKAMDRSSGSGVFARDPDAILDMIELDIPDSMQKQEENKAICNVCKQYLDAHYQWQDDLSQDDLLSSKTMLSYSENVLDKWQMKALNSQVEVARKKVNSMTAWRIESTLREFPRFNPVNIWFDYPIHRIDDVGTLQDIKPEVDRAPWQTKKKSPKEVEAEKLEALRVAFEANDLEGRGRVKLTDLQESTGWSANTVKKYIEKSKEYKRENGEAVKVSKQ